MKKRIYIFTICIAISIIMACLCSCSENTNKTVEPALDEHWVQESKTTETTTVYYHESKNPIIYHRYDTEYTSPPQSIDNVKVNVLDAILDSYTYDKCLECSVGDYPALLFQSGDTSYLCWTISPETTCILEYNSLDISEADIFRMAESVN